MKYSIFVHFPVYALARIVTTKLSTVKSKGLFSKERRSGEGKEGEKERKKKKGGREREMTEVRGEGCFTIKVEVQGLVRQNFD